MDNKKNEILTSTIIWQQILGISVVALVLTLLELFSLFYVIFPGIKDDITQQLSVVNTENLNTLNVFSPIVKTISERESVYTERANQYIKVVAFVFIGVIIMIVYVSIFAIKNTHILMSRELPDRLFESTFWWAIATVFGIAYFQGFGCILFGANNYSCGQNSFASVSAEWQQNNNLEYIALDTGICDDVPEEVIAKEEVAKEITKEVTKEVAKEITKEVTKEVGRSDGVMTRH